MRSNEGSYFESFALSLKDNNDNRLFVGKELELLFQQIVIAYQNEIF